MKDMFNRQKNMKNNTLSTKGAITKGAISTKIMLSLLCTKTIFAPQGPETSKQAAYVGNTANNTNPVNSNPLENILELSGESNASDINSQLSDLPLTKQHIDDLSLFIDQANNPQKYLYLGLTLNRIIYILIENELYQSVKDIFFNNQEYRERMRYFHFMDPEFCCGDNIHEQNNAAADEIIELLNSGKDSDNDIDSLENNAADSRYIIIIEDSNILGNDISRQHILDKLKASKHFVILLNSDRDPYSVADITIDTSLYREFDYYSIFRRLFDKKNSKAKLELPNIPNIDTLHIAFSLLNHSQYLSFINKVISKGVQKNKTSLTPHDIFFNHPAMNMDSLRKTELEKQRLAYHESGHAIVGHQLNASLRFITLLHTHSTDGLTLFKMPDIFNKEYLLNRIAVCYGGYFGEKTISSIPAINIVYDIAEAKTHAETIAQTVAQDMIHNLGMSEKFPLQHFDPSTLSEERKVILEKEVDKILETQRNLAENIIKEHESELKLLAEHLMKYKFLTGDQVDRLLKTGELNDPVWTDELF